MAWLVPQRLLSHQIHRDNYTANQQQKERELKASWQSVYGFLKKGKWSSKGSKHLRENLAAFHFLAQNADEGFFGEGWGL